MRTQYRPAIYQNLLKVAVKRFAPALLLMGAFFASEALGKTHNSSSAPPFAGTWAKEDGSGTMTIEMNGSNAVVNYTNGTPDSATLVAEKYLDYTGLFKTKEGKLLKATGRMEMVGSGNEIINRFAIYQPNGEIETRGVSYQRLSGGSPQRAEANASNAGSSGGSGSAQQFVQSFYTWYVPIASGTNNDAPSAEVAVDQRPEAFSEKLYRALKKELTAQGTRSGRIGLNSDPFLNSQDPAPRYTLGNVSADGRHQNVEVYAVYGGGRREAAVKARVKEQNGHWVFTDFVYPNGGSLKSRLRLQED